MQPTIYAAILIPLLGLILLTRRKTAWTWRFFVISQVFGGTSAAALPALGGSSLLVPQVGAVALITVALFSVAPNEHTATRKAFATHAASLMLIAYTIVISFFGPRLFAGQIDLVAMRPDVVGGLVAQVPLAPRPSNIAHASYLCGSLLAALATTLMFQRKLKAQDFSSAVLAAGCLHAGFGLVELIASALNQVGVLDFLRNASYIMTDQIIAGVKRLSGTWPEPSAFASVAVPFAVFATEEWRRTQRPLTGLMAIFIWAMTLASTSSSGIVGLVVYVAFFLPRLMFAPRKTALKVAAGFALALAALGVCALFLFFPQQFQASADFVSTLTVNKVDSQSAIERSSWAMQGWDSFVTSHGLGVGAGSFRSSSFALATLGSLGLIGTVLFLLFILRIMMAPMSNRSRGGSMQSSAGWAALMTLVPSLVNGATPDPGLIFALFGGFALSGQVSAADSHAEGAASISPAPQPAR